MKKLNEAKNRAIVVKVKNEDELFDSFDSSPVEERMVREDIDLYLLEKLRDFNLRKDVMIELILSKEFACSEEQVQQALKNHFSNRAKSRLRQIGKESVKRAFDLIWGVLFLGVCLVTSHFLHINSQTYAFLEVLGESASIIGWVAIWEPASYFIYQKREDKNEVALYSCLAMANITTRRES